MPVRQMLTEAVSQPKRDRLGLAARWLLYAARRADRTSAFHRGEGLRRTTDVSEYSRWRTHALRAQITSHFEPDRLRGKDVLDFGCGRGELAFLLATEFGCRSVIGVDLSPQAITQAEAKRTHLEAGTRQVLRFVTAAEDPCTELPDSGLDVICCFDVVEHLLHPAETMAEWQRVLRPGGEVWIWWSPWRGPYGHHMEALLPLPWIHLLFQPASVFAACAERYDDPSFAPRIWDIDSTTGGKRPNKWRTMRLYEPFLNRLTRRRFERLVRLQGLEVVSRETNGFTGSGLKRATRLLTGVPILGECFVSL